MSLLDYERPSLTTDVVVMRIQNTENENNRKNATKKLQILLIQRNTEPQKGRWSLPGGFVDIDEEIENNAKRKLREKTGISGDFYIEQLYTYGALNRDERGRVVSVSYLVLLNDHNHTETSNENAKWFDVDEALTMNLTFDHTQMIEYALQRMCGKAEYTSILFNLLPKEFTIKDCQQVYEIVMGRSLDNFKRRIQKYLVPTNKMTTGKQYRPAELYTYKENNND